jgi:hypothetical protein
MPRLFALTYLSPPARRGLGFRDDVPTQQFGQWVELVGRQLAFAVHKPAHRAVVDSNLDRDSISSLAALVDQAANLVRNALCLGIR